LEERFRKYGLELAEEKTKILEFGRFARRNRKARGEGKPDTFDFLGFTFYCGMDGKILTQTKWLLFKWLNRRSQRKSYTKETFFNGLLKTFPLPEPRIKVSLFYR